jgi:hypothetical protein
MSGRWQEQERWQEFGSITIAQRMVSKRVREASLYTLKGKEKALG